VLAKRLAILKNSSLGEPIIDFTLHDLDDRPMTLSDYRKGKYVLVDFWASWCGPCRAENPHLLKAYNRFRSKNFSVLGVSLDEDGASWKEAVHKDGMPWAQVSDLKGWNGDVPLKYGIQAIPFNFLVDTNGIIIAKNLRGTELEKRLEEVLPQIGK
jgi:peroxiredoxin